MTKDGVSGKRGRGRNWKVNAQRTLSLHTSGEVRGTTCGRKKVIAREEGGEREGNVREAK